MKKGFGIFFAVIGGLNLFVGIGGLASGYPERGISSLFFGIGTLVLGIWMINSSKSNNNNLPTKK